MNEEKLKGLTSLDVLCCENGSTIIGIIDKNNSSLKGETGIIFYPCFIYVKDKKEYIRPFFARPEMAVINQKHILMSYTCNDKKLIKTFADLFLEKRILRPDGNLIN